MNEKRLAEIEAYCEADQDRPTEQYEEVAQAWALAEKARIDFPPLVAALREAWAALNQLWEAYAPEDYLEGTNEDYGCVVLAHRKAWQRAAAILKEAKG